MGSETNPARRVYRLTERTIDKHGNTLRLPEYVLEGWTTKLPDRLILQTRFFAHHGWNVLAIDLPGHCKSEGQAPASVKDAAGFIIDLLDAAGVKKAALVATVSVR